ncbi:DNA mismatch repair protein MutS, partial [Ruminococcaceae bacterium OttesenSCG-928-D13]|nr:DNA mismatch repair protein MutS [Ruminococcaceae bacterium OttesenSCG-928-D13]
MQNKNHINLEFHTITAMLADHALSARAKARCQALAPQMAEDACRRLMAETTGARNILDAHGSPPLTAMESIEEILTLCATGAMLLPDQLLSVERFLVACARLRRYLDGAAGTDAAIAAWGGSLNPLEHLTSEINRCLRAGRVDDGATPALASLRRKIDQLGGQVQGQLASLAQSKKQWLSDGGAVKRNGRYVLPVRREHKAKVPGAVVEVSGTGSTVFIEPAPVAKLQGQ